MLRLLISFIFTLSIFCVNADPGDDLIVTGSIVNLRQGPSTDFPVILKLQQGRRLIEIRRQNNWVEVDTGRKNIKSGWIYASLVESITKQKNIYNIAVAENSRAFKTFNLAFEKLNSDIKQKSGTAPFTKAVEFNDRIIQITANDSWLNASRLERENILADIFNLWSEAVGIDKSITVIVVDKDGEKYMTMLR